MTEMMQSMIRFSWAMSLFGVKQATEMMSALGTARSPRRATTSFDAVSRAAEGQLGDAFVEAFRTGDRWQGDLIDALFGVVDPALDLSRSLASKTLLRGSLAVLRSSAAMLSAAMPDGGGLRWRELQNKLEAFESFQYVDQILGFSELGDATLEERFEQARASGPFLELWLTEGLGFVYAEAQRGGSPRDLLRRPSLDELPEESLIPLHTGMGLSLARHALPDLDADLPAALERLWVLCQRNSRDGFALAAWEALGLVVRQLAPDKVGDVDRELARGDASGEPHEAFWHGLGRGLYFVASQSLPGSAGRAARKVRQEAPAGAPRLNALSGLAWALTLVNFRQPRVLAEFLDAEDFAGADADAVSQGIASAALLWADAAGEESTLEAFLEHQPAGVGAERWRRLVTAPYRAAAKGWGDVKSGPGPGSIFRYRGG